MAIPEERLIELVSAEMMWDLVMPRPECGRMWWFARALIMGQGERTVVVVSEGFEKRRFERKYEGIW